MPIDPKKAADSFQKHTENGLTGDDLVRAVFQDFPGEARSDLTAVFKSIAEEAEIEALEAEGELLASKRMIVLMGQAVREIDTHLRKTRSSVRTSERESTVSNSTRRRLQSKSTFPRTGWGTEC